MIKEGSKNIYNIIKAIDFYQIIKLRIIRENILYATSDDEIFDEEYNNLLENSEIHLDKY